MTKLLQRIEVTLRSFYIFNSNFGQKEGEEEKKILYYYPKDIELNTKIKDVGLSEAIITFTGTFTSDNDCKSLHTQKTTQLFYQPEPGYWLVLVLNVPKEIKLKEGVEVPEYRGGDVSDRIYSALLQQCYYMFRLFAGTFQMHMNSATNTDAARLKLSNSLELFYEKYLLALKLPNCDVIDMHHSIQYLALSKALFLRAHNFIGILRATFTTIDETILLYNEQILCSSGQLKSEDLYSLHEYIVYNVLDKARHSELGGAVLMRSNSSSSTDYQSGGFVNCIQQNGEENEISITSDEVYTPLKVYLRKDIDGAVQAYYLIIYRAISATLCIFIDAKKPSPLKDFYSELHSYIGPQLTNLARDVSDEITLIQPACAVIDAANDTNNMQPKYLFINEQSLKHHTNIFSERGRRVKTAIQSIPRNVINLIADLATPSDTLTPYAAEEVQVKTTNDYWIVRRRCNWRQYYVILLNSKATLLDVTQEARRIFEQELTDDVFFDK